MTSKRTKTDSKSRDQIQKLIDEAQVLRRTAEKTIQDTRMLHAKVAADRQRIKRLFYRFS